MALSFEESKQQAMAAAATPRMARAMVLTANENWQKPNNANLYDYYEDEYTDDSFSTVDSLKNITLSDSQINLTQEKNSQYIPFKIPRYYDGYDLATTSLSIYWVNKNGNGSEAVPVDVYYNDSEIRFAWLIDDNVTGVAGKINFEIHAHGTNSKGYEYIWKTKANDGINVIQALEYKEFLEPDETWQNNFIQKITDEANKAANEAQKALSEANKAKEAAQEAQNVAQDVETQVANLMDGITDEVGTVVDAKFEGVLDPYATWADTKLYVDTAELNIEAKLNDYATRAEIPDISNLASTEYVDTAVAGVDVSDQLTNYALKTELEPLATKDELNSAIANLDLSNTLEEYAKKTDLEGLATEEYVKSEISNIDLGSLDLNKYYTKSEADDKFATQTDLATTTSIANTNKDNISALTQNFVGLQDALNEIDTSPRKTYDVAYNDTEDPDVGENVFVLYEIENEGLENEVKEAKKKFTIVGGSGGSGTSSVLKIEYVTKTPIVATVDDSVVIKYNFSGTDSSGDEVLEANATWKIAGKVVATNTAVSGENSFDVTQYISLGTQKVNLSIVDEAGSLVTKSWTVQKVDVRIESNFNDKLTYPIGEVSLDYTPYGAINKTVHFKIDGKEVGTVDTTASGIPMAYSLPKQTHGAHLVEAYITAVINNNTVESNHIYKDIIWYDSTSAVPVIGCSTQSFTARQYDATNIVYTVYDPTTAIPTVVLAVDGETVSTLKLDSNTQVWQYKSSDVGTHTLTITCGSTVKTIKANIEKLDIEISPVTAGLVFDFNPSGKSNNDADRLWSDGDVAMTVSDNFDWVNGGYQIDENGDQYFCIKAGTSATIDYKLFEDDAKRNGKEFKLVFKTTNVATADATFLSCIDSTTADNYIGVQMNVHEAYIYGQADKLHLPYSEEDIIEFEFNISKNTEDVPMVMGYEDGVATAPMVYDDTYNFTQNTPKVISLGSNDCDLHIYRFKVYNTSLSDRSILNNFIADARNAEEIVSRYERNQIYDENSQLDPDVLAEKCPWLRIIKLEAPYFTNNKSDKVPNTTIQYIYKDGDPILDNWVAYNCMHSGQGTSSNNYGQAGRNLDLIMNKSGIDGVKPYIVLGDGSQVSKVSLTRASVPTNYMNVKVNIASSENANNALLVKRYNTYEPYKRAFVREEGYDTSIIKDTMEFEQCVVFIKETDTDLTTHREFADNDWHFYAIGNVGDSKKSDSSRLTDPDDKYECIIELMDVEKPLSDFPVDTMMNAMGYKEDETTGVRTYTWAKDENLGILYEKINGEYVLTQDTTVDLNKTYYIDILENDDFSEDYTYGWRYIWEDGTDEENAEVKAYCHQKWNEAYRFITTSTDQEFHDHFGDYFVQDSVLYYYLFTLRYLMIDNRAKNLFFHYGKTGEVDSDSNPIRRFDIAMAYDMDSGLGINNYGDLVYRYGLEDTDVDDTGTEVFRESDSTFFCRVRDLFQPELKSMYNTLESQGAWSADGLINQFDTWQAEFPEELWRVDIERKYIRTYNSSFINGKGNSQFLVDMAKGRKKYQRRQFERNQEKYMASKYQSSLAASDNIVIRCTKPAGDLVVPTNYRVKLTPYSYMYLNVKYGTGSPIQLRAEPNKEYEIPYTGDAVDILDIYSASSIKSIGDISPCYPRTVDTSKAIKLKELIIGNETEGYDNPSLTTLTLGANYLLEKLNIENVSGLTQSLNLSLLNNLKELYAKGSNIGGVTFANGGSIETAELPAINAMTMKNLIYLHTLDIASFDKLTTLIVENCDTVDLLAMFNAAPNLNRVRFIGIDWRLENTDIVDKLYSMAGIDDNGYNIARSVLIGTIYVPVMRERQLTIYNATWPDLEFTYDTYVQQFAVTFVNDDGTILDVQYVDKGTAAVDPITRADNPIATPTKKSSVSTDYTFAGWDSEIVAAFANQTITATYSESVRNYTVKYISKGAVLQETVAPYGTNVEYTGATPTYTAEESGYKYYLFDSWDKGGYVSGNKIINAVYDSCEYVEGYFEGKDLSTMRPVEIYAMIQLGLESQYVSIKDTISIDLGYDVTYENVKEKVIVSEKTVFDGTNKYDTGIQLFDTDKSFVLAIDYAMNSADAGDVFAQCYSDSGMSGFRLWYNSGIKLGWGTSSMTPSNAGVRELMILRHVAGENDIHVYTAKAANTAPSYTKLTGSHSMTHDGTLVFGCSKADDGTYEKYASGTVYWSKVWYADLGDEVCRKIACWPHETITFEMCGFKRYYLSNNTSKRCSMSFLAKNPLVEPRALNSSSSTSGGWASCSLNSYLNSRVYNAMDPKWRQLLKQVQIKSSIGNNSKEISSSDCYLAIPAVIEVKSTMTSEPYCYEGEAISYMTSNSSRILYDRTGTAVGYWTRSPYYGASNYQYSVSADGILDYWYTYSSSIRYVRTIIAM